MPREYLSECPGNTCWNAAGVLIAWLIDVTGYRRIPAYFLIGTSVIGLVVVTVWLTETSGRALRGSAPAVEQKREIPEILQEPEEALWWQEEQARIAEQGDHPHSDR